MKKILILTLAAIPLFACGKQAASEPATAAPAKTTTAAPQQKGSGHVVQTSERITGEVLEAKDAPGLTYIRIKTAGGDVWTAVNQTPVKVGSTVTVISSVKAEKFKSTALDRTFDAITFGSLEGAPGPKPGDQPAKPAVMPVAEPKVDLTKAPLSQVAVTKAPGPDAKTISEIWHQRKELAGKRVSVRATVVKGMSGILGKNWIHVRDGSGDVKKGDHELIIVTSQDFAAGTVITASGTLSVDEEIGGGLEYPAILKDPKITK
ncbi:MAG: hypothetical protein ACYC7A_07420 [Thermoanaerobaculia bacterium]